MMRYYPLNLDLKNKKCLVVGAGQVAARKVRRLLECGACVSVIGPQAAPAIKTLAEKKKIAFKNRGVALRDLRNAYLVVSAAGDRQINSRVSSYCFRRGKLVNVADAPDESNFILPAVVRRGSLTITVSTDGLSPALSKKIRQGLEKEFGGEYVKLLRLMQELRPLALRKIKSPVLRKVFFQKAVREEIIKLLRENKDTLARKKVTSFIRCGQFSR